MKFYSPVIREMIIGVHLPFGDEREGRWCGNREVDLQRCSRSHERVLDAIVMELKAVLKITSLRCLPLGCPTSGNPRE